MATLEGGEGMNKSYRTQEIPAMVTITITGKADELFHDLSDILSRENKRRKAKGEGDLPFVINYQSTARPSTVPQVM